MKTDYIYSIYPNNLEKNGQKIDSFRLSFKYKDKNDGEKIKTITPRFDTEKQATKHLVTLTHSYKDQTGIFAPKIEPTSEAERNKIKTFRQYSEVYLPQLLKRIRQSSQNPKKSDMKILVEYFQDKPLSDIQRADLIVFKNWIEEKPVEIEVKVRSEKQIINPKTKRKRYVVTRKIETRKRSVSTVNNYLKRLRAILIEAKRTKLIEEVPDFYELIEPLLEKKRNVVITFDELEKLLVVCVGERQHLKLLIIGLFETGARLSEIKAIKRKDVNFETKLGWVNNSKRRLRAGETRRMVYFPDYLITALIEAGRDKVDSEEFLFTQHDVKRAYKTAKRLSGIKSTFQIRDLRHCHRTNLAEAGVSEIVGDKQIGHQQNTLSRTVYQNLRDDYLVMEMQKYEEFSRRERAKLQRTAT